MTEYAFSLKPHRMTSPPGNNREWLVGNDGVKVRFVDDPRELAFLMREATWGSPIDKPTEEQIRETLEEVASGKALGSTKEALIGWVVQCSRSSMDQALRLREAGAGAQTTRDNDMRDFNQIVPETVAEVQRMSESEIPEDPDLPKDISDLVYRMRNVYGRMVDTGKIPPQDARYIALPLGFQTHYVHVMDPRAFEKMCEQRLCNGITQHETNYITRLMRDEILKNPKFTHFDIALDRDWETFPKRQTDRESERERERHAERESFGGTRS